MILDLAGSYILVKDGKERIAGHLPGCNYLDYMAAGLSDPFFGTNENESHDIGHHDYCYERTFELDPEVFKYEHIELVCSGVDTICKVYINDAFAGSMANVFRTYSFDVKALVKEGENTLRMEFEDPYAYIEKEAAKHTDFPYNEKNYQIRYIRKPACNFGWDWGTDLGSSFIGSYSFYLLGSPFFWLTTIFPSSFVPYMIPWLLALKTAVASVFAYAYIRRFVDDPCSCFVGGLLYGCSGFQIYNVFFNHFHDATAFFPILLIGFEKLVQENKKGAFALAVAINALISYFFFIGECVFLVVYFFLRCTDKEFRITIKKFCFLIFEAVLGVAIGAILFLPACMDILGNPRLTERLWGMDMVFYSENVRIPRILQAFFMLNDMPARINILSTDRARWASMAGYLPMFSMAGVIGFMRTRRKHWLTRSVYVFLIMACIPILNSSFMLFNAS